MEDLPGSEKQYAPQELVGNTGVGLDADLDNAPRGLPEENLSVPQRPPLGKHATDSSGEKTNERRGRNNSAFSILSLVKRPKKSSTIVHNVEGIIH